MRENALLSSFNRGVISPLALARTDLKRTALSAEIQTNWMPRTLGSMMLRPGWKYLDSTYQDKYAVDIPFIFSLDDTAIIELTDQNMRVRIDEVAITRPAVTTAITNSTFNSDLTGWTDADESGATSAWATGGYMSLIGTKFNAAIRTQQVTVSGGNIGVQHALNIVIRRGKVTLKVGTTSGADNYIAETQLGTGTHSIALTPTGNFYISLSSRSQAAALVDSIAIASSGDMLIATPWLEDDLHLIRWDTSGDVIFAACDGYQPRRIERRGTRSWSVVLYEPEDGPFRIANTSTIRLTPSALTGDITVTASSALFKSTQVGSLFRITSTGQSVSGDLSGDGQYTDPIRITGVGASQRTFNISRTGTWTGTLTLQRSVGEIGSWIDVTTYTTNGTVGYNDGLDNQIIYYRVGFNTSGYSSGTATVGLTYSSGGLTGIVRITAFASSTSVSAAVLTALGGTSASEDWAEGLWSDYRGWPSADTFTEGRLWWAGKDKILGSISDAFESFDDTVEGDSGPISRSIGSGPVDKINWLLPLLRLIVGAQLAEHSARSSSLDEPLSPTNFNLKAPSTRGSSQVAAVKVDNSGLFVRGTRLFELVQTDSYADYSSNELTTLCPEIGESGFVRLAVQRFPDTRVHCVRADGKVAVLVYDPAEEVKCWVLVETNGAVEDVFVLPGSDSDGEDKVYYVVNRTIGGTTKRFLERWALESECVGGTLNKQADSFIQFTGPGTAISVPHLDGEEVVVWGDGKDLGTFTVTGGQIPLPESASSAIVGLGYRADYLSTKLAYGAQGGTALTQKKRVNYLGLILANTHYQGLKYGPDADTLDDLPLIEDGLETPEDYVWDSYDKQAFEFPGYHDTDSRIYLQAAAPRPCTILATVIGLQTHEK